MKSLARAFFKLLFFPIVWFIYRMRRSGLENIPRHGGVLLLCNHVSYIDSFIMFLSSPRTLRFVVLESYTKMKYIGWFLTLFGGIPIRPDKAKEALMRTVEAIQAGGAVCIFPEGGLTRHGVTNEFKRGFEIIVRKAGCEVVPVYMDGLWNSIFSYERERYFRKWPKRPTCPLQVAFGKAIPPGEATVERVRTAIWEMSGTAFSMRRDFDRSLESAAVRSLKRKRGSVLFAEYGKNGGREWTRADTLGLATAMARRWMARSTESEERIGILLPSGPMTSAIHLGLFLAGRTPVNLPFTIDQRETEAVANSIAPLRIRTVITSRAFMPHLMDFWQGEEGVFIDIKSVTPPPGSALLLLERMRARFEPAWLTCWRLDLGRRASDREAVGMVPRPGEAPLFLTSSELFRNARAVTAADFVREGEVIFTEDDHSSPEGLLLGCWVPLLGRGRSVSRSLSMREDAESLEKSLLEQGVGLVAGSTKFFRRIAHPLGIRSLRYGLLFGTASHWEIADWEKALDLPLARAWSVHGRIATMSRPDPNEGEGARHGPQRGRDAKSVGRFLPGIAGELRDSRLWLKFPPERNGVGEWLPGPEEAEIDPDGLVHLRDGISDQNS